MERRAWTRDELVLAMNLYCQLPFGRLHARAHEVVHLADKLNRTAGSVAMKLCNLASLDPAHQARGIRGLSKVSQSDRAVWEEFHADWNRLAAESEQLREAGRASRDARGAGPPVEPAPFVGKTEVERKVRVRLAQRFFRRAVLAAYESRCGVSEIGVRPLLVASHILPWSKYPQHRADPRNGICLSRLHDAAFDCGMITFDDDYRLVLSAALRDAATNATLNDCFRRFEGRPLQLPHRFRPNTEYLATHRETVFRA